MARRPVQYDAHVWDYARHRVAGVYARAIQRGAQNFLESAR